MNSKTKEKSFKIPNTLKTHQENRIKVCLYCFKKPLKSECRLLNEEQKAFFHKYRFKDFLKFQGFLPNGICSI